MVISLIKLYNVLYEYTNTYSECFIMPICYRCGNKKKLLEFKYFQVVISYGLSFIISITRSTFLKLIGLDL